MADVRGGATQVGGETPSAGTNAGNPVKVGGPFNTTQPTVTNGQMVDGQHTARGAQIVATGVDVFTADTELPAAAVLADAASNPTAPMVGANALLWNGTTWDREQNNVPLILFPSATRTFTVVTNVQRNRNGKGLWLHLSVTAAGTGHLSVLAYGYDQISGNGTQLNAGTVTVTGVGRYIFQISPELPATLPGGGSGVFESTPAIVPESWVASVIPSDGSNWTYSMSATIMR